MARIIADRVMESSTTTGTGDFTLSAAVTGFRRFSSVCATSDTFDYAIFAVDSVGTPTGDWETGRGTYSAANTLTRTTVQASSNANAAVNFAAGTKYVMLSHNSFSTIPAVNPTVDNTLPRFDGTTGLIQTSGVIVDDNNIVYIQRFAGGTNAPTLQFNQARGSLGSATATQASDQAGSIVFRSYSGSAYQTSAAIYVYATEAGGTGSGGTMVFQITPTGTTVTVDRMIIEQLNSVVLVSQNPAAVDYLKLRVRATDTEYNSISGARYTMSLNVWDSAGGVLKTVATLTATSFTFGVSPIFASPVKIGSFITTGGTPALELSMQVGPETPHLRMSNSGTGTGTQYHEIRAFQSFTFTTNAFRFYLSDANPTATPVLAAQICQDGRIIAGATTGLTSGTLCSVGNRSFSAWSNVGALLSIRDATLTDTSTATSGTAAISAANVFGTPTLATTNATTTITDAATVYIKAQPVAGTNVTITNAWALWVDDGNVRLDGNLQIAGTTKIGVYTVATLPTAGTAGRIAFATNCRVFNGAGTQEGAGVGTGGLVTDNGTAWKIAGTNVTAVA